MARWLSLQTDELKMDARGLTGDGSDSSVNKALFGEANINPGT